MIVAVVRADGASQNLTFTLFLMLYWSLGQTCDSCYLPLFLNMRVLTHVDACTHAWAYTVEVPSPNCEQEEHRSGNQEMGGSGRSSVTKFCNRLD